MTATAATKLLVLAPDLVDDPCGRKACEFLEPLHAAGTVSVEAIAWADGPGLDDLRALGPTAAVSSLARRSLSAFAERLLVRAHRPEAGHAVRRRRLGIGPWSKHRPDGVYLTSPRAAPLLR